MRSIARSNVSGAIEGRLIELAELPRKVAQRRMERRGIEKPAPDLVTASTDQKAHELIERSVCSFRKPVPDMFWDLIWLSRALVYWLTHARVQLKYVTLPRLLFWHCVISLPSARKLKSIAGNN
jgi:hypothetical protein